MSGLQTFPLTGFQLGETRTTNEMLLTVCKSCERSDRIPGIHCFSGNPPGKPMQWVTG
ncbi:hypothetical protein CM1200mP19_1470 [bacterium]|nr:MAG: hypothetical protein CM1200mP19_1470 [bacterium]